MERPVPDQPDLQALIWDPDDLCTSMTWRSSDGALVLCDNGRDVWRGSSDAGGAIGGNGKLVLGKDQDSCGGGFGKNGAFRRKSIAASLAFTALASTQISAGPVHTSVDAGGKPVDSTGRATYSPGGSLTATLQAVVTSLYVSRNGQ